MTTDAESLQALFYYLLPSCMYIYTHIFNRECNRGPARIHETDFILYSKYYYAARSLV